MDNLMIRKQNNLLSIVFPLITYFGDGFKGISIFSKPA